MVARPIADATPSAEPKQPDMAAQWRDVLNALRVIALECRVAAQMDLFKACALLSTQPETARDAHARALIKCLRQVTSRTTTFFRPGTEEISFDEAWLVQALSAIKRGDGDSFSFLVRSRVPREHQRHIAFLIKGISEQFSQV
ncbi:hypothetical protein TW80_16735 [Loktanella sp. S4079]|nr:hypothetical protein TW80_16735 [Loktanella sp. S4079]